MPHLTPTAAADCAIAYDQDDQKFLFISPNVHHVLGLAIVDLYKKPLLLFDIIDPADRDNVKTAVKNILPNQAIELRYRIFMADGGVKEVYDKKSIFIDEQTGHKVLLSVINLSKGENTGSAPLLNNLNFLFDNNPNPMLVYQLVSLRILKVNKAAIERYGYTKKEFLKLTIRDLRPESEQEKFDSYIFNEGLYEPTYEGFSHNGVWKHQNKKGELIYAEITSHFVRFDNNECRVVVATDVTEKIYYQEEMHLREKFLNSLIDSQTNFLIRLNAEGNFTFVNKQFLKVFGYKKNEIVGKHFSFTIIPEELTMCEAAFIDCIGHPGKVIRLLHKKKDKAGNLHDTEWEFIAITNDQGAISEIQGVGQDVTHKLSIEKEIKQTAKKLDNFIESITDSFFIINNEWKFVKVNAAFEKIARKTRNELLGTVIWESFPVIIGTAFERAYREAAEKNISIQFIENMPAANMWFNTSVYPSAEGLTVFIKDITDEKRAQEEAIWTKNSLEALINNTEDQIWSVDKETRYVYMNKAYRSIILGLTGHEPLEGTHSYLHAGFSELTVKDWSQYYGRALAGERYTIINEAIDPITQQTLSFEISFNPIYKIKGDITGIGCFARNITERLKNEQAIVDQNERLRNIASLSSHELRRPVASMLGLINIMDRQNFFNPDNKDIIEHLLTVGNEIDEVIRLIVDKTFTTDTGNRYRTP